MSDNVSKIRIEDMLECIDDIMEFKGAMGFDEFVSDKKTKYAVLRSLTVLGEAAGRLPASLRNKFPDVEWNRIIRSRHIIIHEYGNIDFAVIWKIMSIYLLPLRDSLKKILKELDT